MPQSTYRSFVGVAKEAKPAAGVAPVGVAPTFYLPVTKYDPVDKIDYLFDKAWRGSQALDANAIAGPIYGELDMGGDVFADAIGFPLAGILGDVVTTGASAPFSHAISLLNSGTGQPVSYSLTDTNGVQPRRLTGCQFHEVSIKWDAAGLVTYDAKATAFASGTVTAATAGFSGLAPAPAWGISASVAGTPITTAVSGSIDLKRKVKVIHSADGTQAPYAVFIGDLEVTGKAVFIMEDESQLTNYLSNSQPALDLNYTNGSGATLQQVKLHGSKVAYTLGKINRGAEYQALDVDLRFLANTTDAGASGGNSPIKVTLQNALASGTYA